MLLSLLLAAVVDQEERLARVHAYRRFRDDRLGFVRTPSGNREPLAIGFDHLQTLQRGVPESLFHDPANPGVGLSCGFQWALEHTGDLVHRAAFTDNGGGGWEYGIGAVSEKVNKLLRAARSMTENPRDNPEFVARKEFQWHFREEADPKHRYRWLDGLDEEGAIAAWKGALLRYSKAYAELPAVTRLQRDGKWAAVYLGRLDLTMWRTTLSAMHTRLEDARHAGEQAEFDLYYRDRVPPSRFR